MSTGAPSKQNMAEKGPGIPGNPDKKTLHKAAVPQTKGNTGGPYNRGKI